MSYGPFPVAQAVGADEPHARRRRILLANHPELTRLIGPFPGTGVAILLLVAVQTSAAIITAGYSWWVILAIAYSLGAVANLGCWVLIHEGAHNLIGRSSKANRWWSFVANLPILIPAAAHFRFWHRHHHRRQGEDGWDLDLPHPVEVALVKRCPVRKALWLTLFIPLQTIRAFNAADMARADRWLAANVATGLLYAAIIAWFGGPSALAYLLLSSWFAMGPHPLGARWIQEHFILHQQQETTSYYGPMNSLLFNCGYHNEHHDLPGVAWLHLPKLRREAPELYDGLYSTRSWSALLWRFLMDRNVTLDSRIRRAPRAPAKSPERTLDDRLAC